MAVNIQDSTREKLTAAVRRVGPKRTAEVLGLNVATIGTALSGMRAPQPATVRAIEASVDALDALIAGTP